MASLAQLNPADGLPSSVHTEVAILGAMLLDGVAISDATAKLKADDFSLDSHQRIYRAMVELMAKGHGIDYLTVQEELARRRELDSVGGSAYLAYLTEGIPRNFNIESYVRIVKDKSLLRQLMGDLPRRAGFARRTRAKMRLRCWAMWRRSWRMWPTRRSSAGCRGLARLWRRASGRSTRCMSRGARLRGWRRATSDFDRMTSRVAGFGADYYCGAAVDGQDGVGDQHCAECGGA